MWVFDGIDDIYFVWFISDDVVWYLFVGCIVDVYSEYDEKCIV